jgi:hypothetical protein
MRVAARSLTHPARDVVLEASRRGTLNLHDGLRRVVQGTRKLVERPVLFVI